MKPAVHRRVLVPMDGSVTAECVLPHVWALIRPGQTHVMLLSVLITGLGDRTIALMSTYPPGLQLSVDSVAYARTQTETYLRDVAARCRERGATTRVTVREGHPAEEILVYAQQNEADLIVMSAHGLSGVSRWVYGSVADRVLRGATCPVLLIKSEPVK